MMMSADPAGHEGCDIANLIADRSVGLVGRKVCLSCDVVLSPLVLCGQPTRAGHPCRVPVRADLGYARCWSHGEGAGRTSTPRRALQGEQVRLANGGKHVR